MEDRLTPTTWPVELAAGSEHQMYNGHGAGTTAAYKFHAGVDIWVDGMGGQHVIAARSGEVVRVDPGFLGGRVAIKVNLGGGQFEVDGYLHIDVKAGLTVGQNVAEGEQIGRISQTVYAAGRRHLHYEVTAKVPTGNFANPPEDYLNPLERFPFAPDMDPLEYIPELRDTNNDDKTLLVVQSGAPAAIFTNQPINGDVDLIADAVDPRADAS